MRTRLAWVVLVSALAGATAPAAQADIFGVAPVVAPGHSDIDIGLMNLSTGASLPLPAGVNTAPAAETHPTISTDGRRIAFERVNPAAGTDRLVVADLTTGQTMDLFNAFETAELHPTSPAITLDGQWVNTGSVGTSLHGRGLGAFPTEADPQTNDDIFPGIEIEDPTQSDLTDPPWAFRLDMPKTGGGTRGLVVLEGVPGASAPLAFNSASFSVAHPSIASSGGVTTMVYDVRKVDATGNLQQGDIGFCQIWLHNGNPCGLGQGQLPALVNTSRDETRPAFTPDGRYIGFIRDEASGHERVYVFDTQTQTLIDADGTDLGPVATLDSGNLSLYEKPVLRTTSFPQLGTVVTTLTATSPIGLFVQRIVGHHRLLGRRAPKLRTVGRIPLGRFRRGHHRIRWRPVVDGHRLRPGRYQFTVRALTKSGKVRDLGRPLRLRVR